MVQIRRALGPASTLFVLSIGDLFDFQPDHLLIEEGDLEATLAVESEMKERTYWDYREHSRKVGKEVAVISEESSVMSAVSFYLPDQAFVLLQDTIEAMMVYVARDYEEEPLPNLPEFSITQAEKDAFKLGQSIYLIRKAGHPFRIIVTKEGLHDYIPILRDVNTLEELNVACATENLPCLVIEDGKYDFTILTEACNIPLTYPKLISFQMEMAKFVTETEGETE